mmetsp:Transcript_131052/g.326956  ORF Transcript_131052/g.326956 Transcript_131052/m.326956 type:complete len:303 (+) Transcript_131052:80-988(+)|eukprot:CAMPEP_0115385370 /NCGR_PEP_ID=MMETSP0271-20121206/7594_1 /TAXON_ID=71861 /ORGANISM="Scrippsiella trochoidea, Strain CCMP3099" /LENGTH=302 /DNA_ID=CAMNT_0002808765 /DNA_START=70 /DNA_END=978 /DNA_ORIENTATION=+
MAAVDILMSLETSWVYELLTALGFAVMWAIFIQWSTPKMSQYLPTASWWAQALPNQISLMHNFGFPKEGTTEVHAIFGFTWIVNMCITHIISALFMLPVAALGWGRAGAIGRLAFILGTLCEVGFDIFDFSKLTLLTFFPQRFPRLGPQTPVTLFCLIGVLHHTTVLSMVIPMNLKYAYLEPYHAAAFWLLFSAGVCYITGQYKFTLDGRTKSGLAQIKAIVMLQLVMNVFARWIIWFPAIIAVLRITFAAGDIAYFRGACFGGLGMSLYNIVIVADAFGAAAKWLPRRLKEDEAEYKLLNA